MKRESELARSRRRNEAHPHRVEQNNVQEVHLDRYGAVFDLKRAETGHSTRPSDQRLAFRVEYVDDEPFQLDR